MSTPNQILDGVPLTGTTPVTCNSVTYGVNRESCPVVYEDASNKSSPGRRNQKIWVKQPYVYSGEWQLPSGSSAYPPPGATFTRTLPNEASPITFVVLRPGYEATIDVSIRAIPIEAEEVVNSITTA